MYQNNYPGGATSYPFPTTPAHPQTNPWAGEISGAPSMPPYADPPVQQGGLMTPYASSHAFPGTTDNPIVPAAQPELNMNHGLSDATIHTPQNSDDAYMGSLKAMLNNNVGNHIIASFLIGGRDLMSLEGTLYEVGNNYLTIYQEALGRYVIGDFYSLKFAEFNETGQQNNGGQQSL